MAHGSWRLKFSNWICAALPGAASILEQLEGNTTTEVTPDAFEQLMQQQPLVEQLSAQLRATLVSLVEEPLKIMENTPTGKQAGLAASRRPPL